MPVSMLHIAIDVHDPCNTSSTGDSRRSRNLPPHTDELQRKKTPTRSRSPSRLKLLQCVVPYATPQLVRACHRQVSHTQFPAGSCGNTGWVNVRNDHMLQSLSLCPSCCQQREPPREGEEEEEERLCVLYLLLLQPATKSLAGRPWEEEMSCSIGALSLLCPSLILATL